MKSMTRDGVLRGGYVMLIRLLLAVAAGVSGYLLSVSLSGGSAIGCGPGSACDEVLQSRWAYVFGVPVSVFALVLDAALLLTTFSCGPKSQPKARRKAWELLFLGALLVLAGALWFVALQIVVVQAICKWCMTAHAAGSIAAVMLLLRLPLRETADRRDKEPAVLRSTAVKLAAVALLAFALFAVGQVLVAPKTSMETVIPAATTSSAPLASNSVLVSKTNIIAVPTNPATPAPALAQTSAPAPAAVPTNVTSAVPPGWLGMFGGAVKINLREVPIWGSPDAPHKLVSLYDYSCHHCAAMHSRVQAVAREFPGKLAVVSLPMPLDNRCNPLIKRAPPAHINACAYAKLGLAVWRAKPGAIEAYDDWFFEVFNSSQAVPPQPPSLEAAKQHAIGLLGDAGKLEQALLDPWIDQQIAMDVGVFEVSWKEFKNDRMPQFIIGTNLVSGILEVAQLRAIVEKYVTAP